VAFPADYLTGVDLGIKREHIITFFAKETKVDHLEDLREGGTACCWRALKEVNSSAHFNLTLFYYFSFL